MSEYVWRVRKAWIGVMQRIEDERGLFKEDKLLGVIRRSGTVRAMGHFCSVEVSVCGKKYFASGAEDRIFPFHSIKLLKGDKVPDLELEAIGWCKGGNVYAFRKDGELVEPSSSGQLGQVSLIPKELWKDDWI